MDVLEVLNVHMNESKKNLLFLEGFFFSSSETLTFEKENLIFFNTYLNFNLFYLILVIFFINFVHMNVQNFRYMKNGG